MTPAGVKLATRCLRCGRANHAALLESKCKKAVIQMPTMTKLSIFSAGFVIFFPVYRIASTTTTLYRPRSLLMIFRLLKALQPNTPLLL